MLDVDRLVLSFRKTTGLETPADPYGGWEASNVELRGHFVGMLQPSGNQPRRLLLPQRETSKKSILKPSTIYAKKGKEEIAQGDKPSGSIPNSKIGVSVAGDSQEDASITPPSQWGSSLNTQDENFKPCNFQRDQPGISFMSGSRVAIASSDEESGCVPVAMCKRRFIFPVEIMPNN